MKKPKGMPLSQWKELNKQYRNQWQMNPVTRKPNKNKWKEVREHEKEKCN